MPALVAEPAEEVRLPQVSASSPGRSGRASPCPARALLGPLADSSRRPGRAPSSAFPCRGKRDATRRGGARPG
jgi:hypothetical protein